VSNPSTGYSWQLAEPLDESVVELVSSEFEKKSVEGGEGGEGEIVGAPGEEIWTLEAIAEGEVEIEFEYVRSWETGVAPEETKTFKVKITSIEEGVSP
jgi:predicted secreted protein